MQIAVVLLRNHGVYDAPVVDVGITRFGCFGITGVVVVVIAIVVVGFFVVVCRCCCCCCCVCCCEWCCC